MPTPFSLSPARHPSPASGRTRGNAAAGAIRRRGAFTAGAHRLAPRVLLALALLVVQLGALTHLIGHAGAAPERIGHAASGHEGERLPDPCLQCLALAGLDLPLADATPSCVRADVRFDHARHLDRAPAPIERRTPRCRAPPAVSGHPVTL